MFLLVPAYPGSPGQKAVKRLYVCVCVCVCVCLLDRLLSFDSLCLAAVCEIKCIPRFVADWLHSLL